VRITLDIDDPILKQLKRLQSAGESGRRCHLWKV